MIKINTKKVFLMGVTFASLAIFVALIGIYIGSTNDTGKIAKASELENTSSSSMFSVSSQDDSKLSPEEKIRKKVRENPDAGIEAIDKETLDRTMLLINTFPKQMVEKELKNQLDKGYITQKQYDQLMQKLNER